MQITLVSVCGVVQDAAAKPNANGGLGDTSADATPDGSPKSHPVPMERPLSGAGEGASGTASSGSTAAAATAAAAAGAVNKGGAEASKPVFKSKKRQVLCTDCKPLCMNLDWCCCSCVTTSVHPLPLLFDCFPLLQCTLLLHFTLLTQQISTSIVTYLCCCQDLSR